jgi:CubicO group peptidase (beta-lactamase class C family)
MANTYARYSAIPASAAKTWSHHRDKADGGAIKPIPYLYADNIGATGGVWSCADDMAKWLQFLQDSARVGGQRLVRPETFAFMFQPHALIPRATFYPTAQLTQPHWTSYGLGWFQHDYRGKMVQLHTGSLAGLVAIVGMIPDEKIGIYVFGNLDHSEIRHALVYKAFDLWAFNDDQHDWSQRFYDLYQRLDGQMAKVQADAEQKRVPDTRPSLALAGYVGRFSHPAYGQAEVVLRDQALAVLLPNDHHYALQHWHYDTFAGQSKFWWMGKATVQFQLDARGQASRLTMLGLTFTKDN